MNWNVLVAIFKRNFISYFSNPTGYVFICVFVLLSSLAAFWPHEFFNANLANLDQLNQNLPYIMLIFIPAITMSIWADERRQGTDELLLTIPAGDLDVVVGKFLAALAIFSVSLAFSMFSNFCVLGLLGRPDVGLFVGTYVGYWLVGMAMISIGMIASFLTGNLTVGFILGALFNLPLAFSAEADVIIKQPAVAHAVREWSLGAQLQDFQRGVLSLSSTVYFVMITVVSLYLCVVLIGRRHWLGGRDGSSMLGHYIVRTLSLVAVALGVSAFFSNYDLVRLDITSERLSSLSPDTRQLIRELDVKFPVTIEAYVSPRVPTEYVQTRLNLLSTLDELKSLGGDKVRVETNVIENFSKESVLAEQKYGIKPQTVVSKSRGARTQEDVYLAVAFTCGLDKVVLPFVDKGVPVEYELVRSICTVAEQKRKKVGVLSTDAQLFGRFNMQTMSPGSNQLIIEELEKQYEVVQVDPTNPISEQYDVLLAVQPSSLAPEQMDNFLAAVKRGQPTAIFEDPFPIPQFWGGVVGTSQPRRPQQQNPFMMMGQPPQQPPKGDLQPLWEMLGVRLEGDGENVVWQQYNPYPKGQEFISPEWVFIDSGSGAKAAFNEEQPISSRLQQVLFMYPGSLRKRSGTNFEFSELAATGERTGTIGVTDLMTANQFGAPETNLAFQRVPTHEKYVIAARITGKLPEENLLLPDEKDKVKAPEQPEPEPTGDEARHAQAAGIELCEEEEESGPAKEKKVQEASGATPEKSKAPDEAKPIDVVVVADIDCLVSAFFALRSRGEEQEDEIQWDFDNVTFVLNILDSLAGDDRFIEIRKRRRPHRTLETVEHRTEQARMIAAEKREEFNSKFEKARAEEQKKFQDRIGEIEKREGLDRMDKQIQIEMARREGQRRLDVRIEQLQQERDRNIKEIERGLAVEIRGVQDGYKLRAALLPPIPPLLLAFFVFFHRRQQEREGVSRSRLR